MRKTKMNKIKTISLICVTLVWMTACVDKEKNKLDNRVIDFWNAKINKDFKKAYQFLSPGWKMNEDEKSYIQRMAASKIKWLNVDINDKKCREEDLCQISLTIEYEYQFRGAFSEKIKVPTNLEENWIMEDNTWYFVPEETKLK
jgi:hypothetical protein